MQHDQGSHGGSKSNEFGELQIEKENRRGEGVQWRNKGISCGEEEMMIVRVVVCCK